MKSLLFVIILLFTVPAFSQEKNTSNQYYFASIEFLIEQEVGRIVLPQIYKNIGVEIYIEPLPAKRAQFVAKTGVKDGEIMRIWTYGNENKATIRVPTPYYYLETMPFFLKGKGINISSKAQLSKYTLARVRGVKHTNNITQGMTDVYEMNSTENMFKLLKLGRVDVVLTNTLDGNLILEKLGYDNVISMEKPLAVLPLYHYVHKRHKNLVPLINKEISRLKSTGELAKMIQSAEQVVIAAHR